MPGRGKVRVFFVTLLTIVGLVAAVLLLFYVSQRKLIYLPYTEQVPSAAEFFDGGEDVVLTTEDGLRLGAWFLRGAGPSAPTVLVFNGNAGDRTLRAPLAEQMLARGLNVMLVDYRGYGGNPGAPTEAGLALDARAARDHLAARADVDPRRLVIYGESLGSGVAVGLATEHPPAALVLRSPFTSLVDAARAHYPFLPVKRLLRDRYPSLARIATLDCPVLVIAGDADSIVPPEQSRRLYEAVSSPKRIVMLPGLDHNDEELSRGAAWMDDMLRFLDELATGREGPPVASGGGNDDDG